MKYLLSVILVFIALIALSQQINIPRVDEMPDFPQPYHMRDWKASSQNYDSLVFNLEATGQYFPLASVFENTTNYPDHPGIGNPIICWNKQPSRKRSYKYIACSCWSNLVGIDKSNQNGINWPLYCEEYFNGRPEENIYLNGPMTSSGHDWWYETMPNVFFYQLNYLYPNTGDFDYQVTTIADRWLEAVYAMGWKYNTMGTTIYELSGI